MKRMSFLFLIKPFIYLSLLIFFLIYSAEGVSGQSPESDSPSTRNEPAESSDEMTEEKSSFLDVDDIALPEEWKGLNELQSHYLINDHFKAAETYTDVMNYSQALTFYRKALKIALQNLGDNHNDTASCYNSIGWCLYKTAKYDQAIEAYQKAIEIGKSLLGDQHPDIATGYSNLGLVYLSLKEKEKAFESMQKAFTIRTSSFHESFPEVATAYNNMALAYLALEEYEQAKKHIERAMELDKRWLNTESHPVIASRLMTLGILYSIQGFDSESLDALLKAVRIQEKFYGKDHLETASAYLTLSKTYHKMGVLSQAEKYALSAMKISETQLGETHPFSIDCYSVLLQIYIGMKQERGMIVYYRKLKQNQE